MRGDLTIIYKVKCLLLYVCVCVCGEGGGVGCLKYVVILCCVKYNIHSECL